MKRREFLKRSLAASALTGTAAGALSVVAADREPSGKREYYEWRVYHLKSPGDAAVLHEYLQGAAIPALNKLGVKPVGVFTQMERKVAQAKEELRDESAVWMLIPYPTLEVFATATARVNAQMESEKAGATYLRAAKSSPSFERIESWLMLAFSGMPRIELPPYSREKRARMFEVRTYESHSELKALKKVSMFNSGEIEVMRKVGLGPVFYGQALIGHALPHLTYMLSAENEDEHKKHWGVFRDDPTWKSMSADPQYADTVSKITNRFLVPAAYSQV
ncbi:MAG: NIPSNAP family containing protein [Verrucomicrobia bacterium]|nr:MAG: NIPSNAP family containing protein [Verrucomicrobiota bacterium]